MNIKYIKKSLKYVWHPCSQMKDYESVPLIPIQKGRGSWLYDFEGKKYLDVTSSWWVNLFGHNNKRIKQYIKKQLDELEHSMLAGLTHNPVIKLSEKLSKLTKLSHCSYGSDGSNAVEIALKMSVQFWHQTGLKDKKKFVYLENSYHGETLGSLSVTDIPLFRSQYSSLMRPHIQTLSPDLRLKKDNQSKEDFTNIKLKSLAKIFEKKHSKIASIIVEPMVQGASGMAIYDSKYLVGVKDLCNKYKIHFIADEIAVGFGRTGKMFAHQHAKVDPDFICLSKGLTGGYLPLSVTLTTDKIYKAFYHKQMDKAFLHSHSYTGNPLACSAALGTLSIFESDNVLEENKIKSKSINLMFAKLNTLAISNIRNIGMIWAFELNDGVILDKAVNYCIDKGVLIRPIGRTFYYMPPYCIKDSEARFMIDVSYDAIKSAGG